MAVYSTYGNQTLTSGSDVTPFGFQGSYTDSTGLIYLVNRYYDPTTDQFISIDPDVAMTGQPYVFTNDNPLNATDPLGRVGDPCSNGKKSCMKKAEANLASVPSLKSIAKIAIIVVSVAGGAACVMATVGVCGALAFSVGSMEVSGGSILVGMASGAASGSADYALTSGKHTVTGYLASSGKGAAMDAVLFGVPEELVFGGVGKGAHAADLNWGQALVAIPKYLGSLFK
jgi:RHS repeat-associated protein